MKPSEALRKSKELISTPAEWCKGAIARTVEGFVVEPWASNCCQRCASGALRKVIETQRWSHFRICRNYLERCLPSSFRFVSIYNDHPDTTHEDIMALFDRAIALAESEGR